MELFSSATIMMLFLACAVGAVAGAVFYRVTYSDETKSKKLEDELEQLKHDHEIYKQSVTDHFNTTSELVNNLTENYVEVYKHLSEGAQRLADTQQLQSQLGQQQTNALLSSAAKSEDEATAEIHVEPPKDYAPPPTEEDPSENEPDSNKPPA